MVGQIRTADKVAGQCYAGLIRCGALVCAGINFRRINITDTAVAIGTVFLVAEAGGDGPRNITVSRSDGIGSGENSGNIQFTGIGAVPVELTTIGGKILGKSAEHLLDAFTTLPGQLGEGGGYQTIGDAGWIIAVLC